MLDRVSNLARHLTEVSVRRPRLTVASRARPSRWCCCSRPPGSPARSATRPTSGPNDPAVQRLSDFFEEFDSGLHVLVVFGCPGSTICSSIREQSALEFIGRLQARPRSASQRSPDAERSERADRRRAPGDADDRRARRRMARYALVADWASLVDALCRRAVPREHRRLAGCDDRRDHRRAPVPREPARPRGRARRSSTWCLATRRSSAARSTSPAIPSGPSSRTTTSMRILATSPFSCSS